MSKLLFGLILLAGLVMGSGAQAGCPGIGPLPPTPDDEACLLEDPRVVALYQELRAKVLELGELLAAPKTDDRRFERLGEEIADLERRILAARQTAQPSAKTKP